jgi:hypothetical protein
MPGHWKNLCCPKCGTYVGLYRIYVANNFAWPCVKCQTTLEFPKNFLVDAGMFAAYVAITVLLNFPPPYGLIIPIIPVYWIGMRFNRVIERRF